MITSAAFAGKRYAVLGLARSGAATVDALLASGARVTAWDADEAKRNQFLPELARGGGPPQAVAGRVPPSPASDKPLHHPADGPPPRDELGEEFQLADPLSLDLTGYDGVIVSPGVPLNRHPIATHARSFGVPIIGDIELFAQARASLPPHKVVGITGTNGKSTTTALVHHILQTAGVPSLMGGNIGLPILSRDPLPEGGVYVLELSSFQLDLTFTLDCDVAVLLNITPDHLDRYASFADYVASKERLFLMQPDRHHALLAEDDPEADEMIYRLEHDHKRWRNVTSFHHDAITRRSRDEADHQSAYPALQGPHNAQNAAAAVAIARALGVHEDLIEEALRTYPGLPHRMERVRERAGVLFVNDSKATNPTSTAPALAAYPHVRWILGGQPKTRDFDAARPHLDHVVAAYTIGESAELYERLLRAEGKTVTNAGTLARAVPLAADEARPGETVLLSPACASFDQFRDYEDRGDQFKALVEALP